MTIERRQIGPYELANVLEQGDGFIIYRAFQAMYNRSVAIKVMSGGTLSEPTFRDGFLRQLHIDSGLQHPNIQAVYDAGQDGPAVYFGTELIEGRSLRSRLGQPLDPALAGRILTQAASALDYANQNRIIHGGLIPDNILIDNRERVVLTDFGFAPFLRQPTPKPGEVGYISPEQGMGGMVDGRSDQYALGCILYEMLTGTTPFRAETVQATMLGHTTRPMPDPRQYNPQISETMVKVLQRALSKTPAERFGTAGEFATAFAQALNSGQAATVPYSPAIANPNAYNSINAGNMPYQAMPTAQPVIPAAPVYNGMQNVPYAMPVVPQPRSRGGIPLVALLAAIGVALILAVVLGIVLVSNSSATTSRDATATVQLQALTTAQAGTISAVQSDAETAFLGEVRNAATAQAKAVAIAQGTAGAQAVGTVQAQITSTAQAQGVAATQSAVVAATQSANETATLLASGPTPTLDQNLQLLHGPDDASITHNANGQVDYRHFTDVNLRDFVTEAKFFNPYSTTVGHWDYGFIFRSVKNGKEYRVSVAYNGNYELTLVDAGVSPATFTTISSGKIPNADLSATGSNLVRVEVKGTVGSLIVNGKQTAVLNVSAFTGSGDVEIVTGLISGDEVKGKATRYIQFKIFTYPV